MLTFKEWLDEVYGYTEEEIGPAYNDFAKEYEEYLKESDDD